MKLLNNVLEKAEKYCQEKGQRLTHKRKLVLAALLQSQKAISAYELIDYCKDNFNEDIPAMSVYRILNFLQDQGLSHRLDLANKYVACSHIACGHKHNLSQFLICSECQHVEEISMDATTSKSLQAGIDKTGFHLSSSQLEFSGVCDKCTTKQANVEKSHS